MVQYFEIQTLIAVPLKLLAFLWLDFFSQINETYQTGAVCNITPAELSFVTNIHLVYRKNNE